MGVMYLLIFGNRNLMLSLLNNELILNFCMLLFLNNEWIMCFCLRFSIWKLRRASGDSKHWNKAWRSHSMRYPYFWLFEIYFTPFFSGRFQSYARPLQTTAHLHKERGESIIFSWIFILLPYISIFYSQVTKNTSEKSINSILDYISTSKQMDLLQQFYETTLDALKVYKMTRVEMGRRITDLIVPTSRDRYSGNEWILMNCYWGCEERTIVVQDEYEIGQAVLRYEGIQKTGRNHLPIEG